MNLRIINRGVNEIPACVSLTNGKQMNDPIGAVWQSNQPYRVLEKDGNPFHGAFDADLSTVGVAQFLTAKHSTLFPPHLNTSRNSIGSAEHRNYGGWTDMVK